MTDAQKKKNPRLFRGVVISDSMDKTIVVRVTSVRWHAKYHRQFRVSKKFKVHDEKNEFKTGELVAFIETRPLSKEKRWRVVPKKGVSA